MRLLKRARSGHVEIATPREIVDLGGARVPSRAQILAMLDAGDDPMMQDSLSVAANSVSANVLAGLLYEFLPAHARVSFLATGSATGLRATVNIGGEQVLDDSAVNLQNRFPIVPDDLLVTDGGRMGERLIFRFRNTTIGALTAFWLVQIVPVG